MHFLLRNAHDPNGQGPLESNVDVSKLHAFGVRVPICDALLVDEDADEEEEEEEEVEEEGTAAGAAAVLEREEHAEGLFANVAYPPRANFASAEAYLRARVVAWASTFHFPGNGAAFMHDAFGQ